jgi:hypothetical protein
MAFIGIRQSASGGHFFDIDVIKLSFVSFKPHARFSQRSASR